MKEKIKITTADKEFFAERGTLLADALHIDRICGGNGSCGKCKVIVDGVERLACRYTVESDIVVEMQKRSEIFSETGVLESGLVTDDLCLALDIGTTTMSLALVSCDERRAVKVITATNPQRAFGADVISRIDYCQRNSVKELHDTLVAEINRMIDKLGVTVDTMFVSANVTMLHTFFNVDCSSIGTAPYTPAFLDSKKESAQALGLVGVKQVVSLPSIGSFVGADIVAGLHLIGMPADGRYNLLIDLGTNAEIVLYSNRSGVASSAAAGPCFEGANISCGMSATDGAICAYTMRDSVSEYKTIYGAPAKGICGTGLIDIIAELIRREIIDETGYMEDDYVISDGVYLSCRDVRQYQLAKSAVYSAVLSLMKAEGVEFDDISNMYISGGFSSKINIDNAVRSGLLPKELIDKAVGLKNSSLQGAVKYACGDTDVEWFTRCIKYVDLSTNPYFNDLFIENMMFNYSCTPHENK
ncbi:MAG: DUF4445 domain-containing protein [Ruminococcaceae bacterium]|nr:DUF4445 domain-containing protein [Oscillospiraceae bacterium]